MAARMFRPAVRVGLLSSALLVGLMVNIQQLNAEAFKRDTLVLVISGKRHTIKIEIAETDRQKALGLMFRKHLGERNGMLFPQSRPQEMTMWMKNTYIPLDMVFIKSGGLVHRIEKNTEPLSEAIITSHGKVIAVLELAGGVSDKLGLKPGDRVIHKSFK